MTEQQAAELQTWQTRFSALSKAAQGEIASALLGRSLTLLINPTEKCNFRCVYCYEDFALGRMTPPVVQSVKRLIDRYVPTIGLLQLQWFGGEPLVASDVVLDIAGHADEACKKFGVALAGLTTTNAALLDLDLATKMVAIRQTEFQISFDGDQEKHDQVRRKRDGSGTFHQIWKNLAGILSSPLDVSVLVRLHLRGENEDSVAGLLTRIRDSFNNDKRVSVMMHPLGDYGGTGGKQVPTLKTSEYLAMGERLKARFPDLTCLKSRDLIQGESAAGGSGVCYAGKPNAFLIRSDGRVGKCTVALNDDFNTVGRLLPDGEIVLDRHLAGRWTEPVRTLDPVTLACPLRLGAAHFRAAAE